MTLVYVVGLQLSYAGRPSYGRIPLGISVPYDQTPISMIGLKASIVADIEMLREKLGIDKWLVFGGSWFVQT